MRREAKTRIQQRDWLAKKFAASSTNHVAGFLFSLRVARTNSPSGKRALVQRFQSIPLIVYGQTNPANLTSVVKKLSTFPYPQLNLVVLSEGSWSFIIVFCIRFYSGSTYEDNSSSLPDRTLASALYDQPSATTTVRQCLAPLVHLMCLFRSTEF